MNLLKAEPTLLIGLVKAALVAAVAFGLPLSGDQTAALIGVATAVLALSAANRQVVTPVAKVERLAGDIGGNAVKLAARLTGGERGDS